MKKLASQSLILVAAVTIATSAFAQSPTNATRQRRSGTDSAQQGSTTQPADDKTVKTSETKTSDAKTSETNAAEAKPSDNKTADSKTADTQTLDVTVTDG